MLKPYLRFCLLAINELLPGGRRKRLLKTLYAIAAFIVSGVIANFFGVPLIKPVKWIYSLLPGVYWWIVALALVVVLLLYMMEGARRVYERTLREDRDRLKASSKLNRLHGLGEAIYRQCAPEAKTPLPMNTFWTWLNETIYAVREEYGQQGVDEFLNSVNGPTKGSVDHRDIPTDLHDQEMWMGAHLIALYNFDEKRRAVVIARSVENK